MILETVFKEILMDLIYSFMLPGCHMYWTAICCC